MRVFVGSSSEAEMAVGDIRQQLQGMLGGEQIELIYDLSMQYITSTTLNKIPHEKKANIALSTGFVRQMQKNSHE